jgi:tetratricopeptide (TPR) repeat protein
MKEQSRQFKKTLSSLILVAIGWIIIGCTDERLSQAEMLMETDSKAADSILINMPIPTRQRDRAWYAVLKTQADYKQYKPITSDSLILTATDYYGTKIRGSKNRRYHSALAWYSQGCVYSGLHNDFSAIDAYLKAKDLFPDTLIRYYALAEQKLGKHYLNRMMLDEANKQFNNCIINAQRLQDAKMTNYAFFHIGLCALYSKDYVLADKIFKEIIENDKYSHSQRSVGTIQLAKINLYYYNKNSDAMDLINRYLDIAKGSEYGPGLSVKADIFYNQKEYDSAFYYYTESMKYYDEPYTRCSNADRLSELSDILGYSIESIHWHKLYSDLRDSIYVIERTREIEELQFNHNKEIVQETIAHKQRRFIIIGLSSLLSIALLFLLFFTLYKSRERKKIMEKQEELLLQEKEIRRSSIQVLQARVSELSVNDLEARLVLLELYKKRLNVCRNRFCNTDSFKKLLSFKQNMESGNLNRKDKDYLFEQLKLSYTESMSDIALEIPDVKEKEILTLLLRHLDLNSSQIAILFSITVVAVKQRMARLSQRAPSDFLKLFSRQS